MHADKGRQSVTQVGCSIAQMLIHVQVAVKTVAVLVRAFWPSYTGRGMKKKLRYYNTPHYCIWSAL